MNLELSKEVPYIYCIKGLVRFEESLDQVHEIVINSNYYDITQVPDITGVVSHTDQKGFDKIEIKYENFDANDLGLLFYGENLSEKNIKLLLSRIVKDVRW